MMTFTKTKPSPLSGLVSGIFSGVLLMAAVPQVAAAQNAVQASELQACQSLPNKDEQLACFLAVTANSAPVAALPAPNVSIPAPVISAPAPAVITAAPVAAPSVPFAVEDSIAAQRASLAQEKARLAVERDRIKAEKDRIAADSKRVAALEKAHDLKLNPPKTRTVGISQVSTFGADGQARFVLQNGEVWQQVDTRRVRLPRRVGPTDTLTINLAALGSFLAQVNDKGTSIRVRQVR